MRRRWNANSDAWKRGGKREEMVLEGEMVEKKDEGDGNEVRKEVYREEDEGEEM